MNLEPKGNVSTTGTMSFLRLRQFFSIFRLLKVFFIHGFLISLNDFSTPAEITMWFCSAVNEAKYINQVFLVVNICNIKFARFWYTLVTFKCSNSVSFINYRYTINTMLS